MIKTTYQCDRCGETFNTQYYDMGAIAHRNETSDWNLQIMYEKKQIHKIPKNKIGKEKIMLCRRLWVQQNHPEYLETYDRLTKR